MIHTDFRGTLPDSFTPLVIGAGRITYENGIRFTVPPTPTSGFGYSDAQISDYARLDRRNYPWTPPMRMTVRAYASHNADQLRGTAGFGLWNQPFMPGQNMPRLPRNVWFFFAGSPSNMALARDVPGFGWKAAIMDATRPAFLALAPTAPLGIFLMRVPTLYRVLYPLAQRALGVSETILNVDLRDLHTYTLEWRTRSVTFSVDDHVVLQTPYAPGGRLGFIAWLDNQYAVVTPQGHMAMGLTAITQTQWLHLDSLILERL